MKSIMGPKKEEKKCFHCFFLQILGQIAKNEKNTSNEFFKIILNISGILTYQKVGSDSRSIEKVAFFLEITKLF